MQSFISRLTEYVHSNHGQQLNRVCIVFPTRRGGLFFKDELAKRIDRPVWSPAIYSIQDFILKMNDKLIPDQLTLLFELYKVYHKYFPHEEFDQFYPWGELLLKDFNDLDNYLVDAEKVFATVKDLHEIDAGFTLDESDMERLKNFWSNFFGHDPSRLKNEFLNTWKHLSSIYKEYSTALLDKGWAYDGMAYRIISEKMDEHSLEVPSDFDLIIFAGFYALSPAEDKIIRYFVKEKNAKVFYDADKYYTDDPHQEAGKFFRNNLLTKSDFNWKENYFESTKKTITITGIPLAIGQAKYAGQLLIELASRPDFVPEKTAVVLPDEKLLLPILYSLPDSIPNVNVTMGYPLSQTPLYDLFESLISLHLNARKEPDGDLSFYFRDIRNSLNHPYVRIMSGEAVRKWLHDIDENYIRIARKELLAAVNDPLFSHLFSVPGSLSQVFEWMRELLSMILGKMKQEEFRFHRLESEFVFHFYTQLKRLEDIFVQNGFEVSVQTFRKIFREIISSVRIPFTGEPLKGLQVMGFLETRVLDFDRLIVLSVNENTLPASGNQPSFIPFNIRKAFGLPTYEDQHAVSAYHFYRLLQRASEIELIYNTEPSGDIAGREPSRFLLQLEHELQKSFPDTIQIRKKIVGTPLLKQNAESITVEKSDAVISEMQKFLWKGQVQPQSTLSASALQSYITCPLKFYFRYVAGLKELEEAEDTMEAATLGTILHHAMETLYKDVKTLDAAVIREKRKRVEEVVDHAIKENFAAIHHLEGKNLLLRNVLCQLVYRILDMETRYGNVKILELEKDVSSDLVFSPEQKVRLYGIIDRLDEADGVIRIIDYKTGRVVQRKDLNIEQLFIDVKLKEQFQTMYYALLTSKKFVNRQFLSGLIVLREMSDGIRFMNNGEPFSPGQLQEFEGHLTRLISAIFDRDLPFVQTDDPARCTYCAYAEMCNR